MGNRTRVQIECPHIIKNIPADLTTEDEELGTDNVCGVVGTANWSRTIEYNADPLLRYWGAKL